MDIPYIGVKPGSRMVHTVKLILTTDKEKDSVSRIPAFTVEDLGTNHVAAKEKLLAAIYGRGEDRLRVGIDPGLRIGLAAFFGNHELYTDVLGSVEDAVRTTVRVIQGSLTSKKVLRIGSGIPELSEAIARGVSRRLRDVDIELVDERGTSSLTRGRLRRRGTRDQNSARMIAFRMGRRYAHA